MHDRQVLSENHWKGIDECAPRYMWQEATASLPGKEGWTRMFLMNHFCCGSGPDARDATVLPGGGNNGW